MRKLLFDTDYPQWLMTTMGVAAAATIISVASSVLAAYALQRLRFRGSNWVGLAIYLAYLVPPSILFIPLATMVFKLGLFDTPWALILTYPTFLIPFCTWLLIGYFKSIPYELEECALIDGASRLQILRRITLPLAVPGLISAGIFAFTLSWNEFIYALAFIQSSEKKTVPVAVLTQLVQGDDYQWGPLMAGALFGSIPGRALLYSFFVEYYVSSLTGRGERVGRLPSARCATCGRLDIDADGLGHLTATLDGGGFDGVLRRRRWVVGAFWCLEAVYRDLKGVTAVKSGYMGGMIPNPTYEQVCTGQSGHAEVVQVQFDPTLLDFADVLRVFFTIHDPTTLNRQGADAGSQYRSVIFTHSEAQRKVAVAVMQEVVGADLYSGNLVTEVTPAPNFFPGGGGARQLFRAQPLCRLLPGRGGAEGGEVPQDVCRPGPVRGGLSHAGSRVPISRGDVRHDGVTQGRQPGTAVQPGGKPINHSTQSGFSRPPTASGNGQARRR